MRTYTKPVLWIVGALAVVLTGGYFIAGAVIHKKVDAAIAALPPSVHVQYGSLHSDLFNSQIDFGGVSARIEQDEHVYDATIEHITLEGIRFWELLRTKRLRLRHLRLTGIKASEEKRHLLLEGNADLDSVFAEENGGKGFGAMHLMITRFYYRIPHADEAVQATGLELDSRKRTLRLDTLRVTPVLGQEEMGRVKHHQVDVWELTSEGIEADGLDVMGLRENRLVADRIGVHRNRIHVFRDRRLPLEEGEKELPLASLRAMPVDLRVGELNIGATTFSYKEYPKEGDEPGTLTINHMTMEIKPLINHPGKGDPAFLTVWTTGSLMNSGTVRARTEIPLHSDEPYRVTGAFHDLDVTSLNNPAERLGHLHLESGMLNQLDFHFEMNDEQSTGLVTGRYHELVVDKLKKNGKVDKFKSFALKHLIIPKTKEQASGKVNYKRDRERYFSYYLLHSLLVGVKSSFSLGFLLPG